MPLTLAIMLAASMPAEQPTPLPATGKWTVNFGEKMCVAEHNFGPDDQPTIFAMRPAPLAHNIEVRVSQVDPGYISRRDEGTVTLLPSGRALPAKMNIFGPVTGGRRVTRFYLDDVGVKDLVTATTIVIDRGHGGAPVALTPDGAEGVVASMARCGDGLLRQWGVDTAAMRKLSRPPKSIGAERNWFKAKDYPKAARGNFRTGRTLALVSIDAGGHVVACNIADSAGNPDLDSKTCSILSQRGRYDPGLDADGKPVSSQKLVAVVWALWPFFGR